MKVGEYYVFYILAAETATDAFVEEKELSNVERVDISLLTGQTLKMRISTVESTTQFYVQLPSATKCENIVNQYMAGKDTKVLFTIISIADNYIYIDICI